jgi:hypothetical protein
MCKVDIIFGSLYLAVFMLVIILLVYLIYCWHRENKQSEEKFSVYKKDIKIALDKQDEIGEVIKSGYNQEMVNIKKGCNGC